MFNLNGTNKPKALFQHHCFGLLLFSKPLTSSYWYLTQLPPIDSVPFGPVLFYSVLLVSQWPHKYTQLNTMQIFYSTYNNNNNNNSNRRYRLISKGELHVSLRARERAKCEYGWSRVRLESHSIANNLLDRVILDWNGRANSSKLNPTTLLPLLLLPLATMEKDGSKSRERDVK